MSLLSLGATVALAQKVSPDIDSIFLSFYFYRMIDNLHYLI